MKNLFFIFLITTTSLSGFSQDLNALNIPVSHPRIFWNAGLLTEAQNWYSSNNFPVTAQDTLSIYDGNDAMDLALKYVLTEGIEDSVTRSDYARRAIEWAKLALIEIEEEPIDPVSWSGTCDACRWYSERMLMIIDWCYDEVYPSEWDMFYNSLNYIIPAWNNAPWGNADMTMNNYNHGYLRQSIEWAFMIYHEDHNLAVDLLEDAIDNRWAEFTQFAGNAGIGGIPSEGTSYNYALLYYHIVTALSMKNAGYDYYNQTDFFKKSIAHTIYNTTPNQTYTGPDETNSFFLPYAYGDAEAFATANVWDEPLDGAYTDFMLFGALYYNGIGDLPEYAKGWVDHFDRLAIYSQPSLYMQSVTSSLPSSAITENPLDYFSPGGGELPYGYTKNSWTDAAVTSAFLQLGKAPVGGHEHLDAGNFTLVKGDRFLIVPPAGRGFGSGWQIPDYAGSAADGIDVHHSIAKNTVLFGETGSAFHAYSDGNADRMRSHEDYFYVANDLTSTYVTDGTTSPSYTNVNCESFTREFVFFRELEVLVVFDRTASALSGDQTKTNIVHMQNQPVLLSPNRYSVVNHNYEAIIDVVLPVAKTISIVDETQVTGYTPREDESHRLQIENTESGTVYFLNVIQAKETGESAVTVNLFESDSTFVISFSHPEKGFGRVEFFKGIHSTKGRIGYDPFNIPYLHALPEGPQEIVVTDDGPEWIADEYSSVTEYSNAPANTSCISASVVNNELIVTSDNLTISTIDLTLYSLTGAVILQQSVSLVNGKGTAPVALQEKGIYLINFRSDECSGHQKILFLNQ